MHFYLVVMQVNGNIGLVQEIVGKLFLCYITFIAKAGDEIVDPIGGVILHDMLNNWLPTNFYHGLGTYQGFFTETGTPPSRQDNCFHTLEFPFTAFHEANHLIR
jgi:hypothetical protein